MACPFFFPTERLSDDLWPRPAWLPLGAGWRGRCTVAEVAPDEATLRQCCNLGYAKGCPHVPADRNADSVRFAITGESANYVDVMFVTQRAYLPVAHGTVQYDRVRGVWAQRHPDARIQKLAECYLEAHLSRKLELTR